MIDEILPAALEGERLDRVVALLAEISRSDAARLVADGWVRVDGAASVSGKIRVREGQHVEIDTAGVPVPSLPEADSSVPLTVVHEDDDLIVVDKQAGLVVHPATGNERGTLVNGLLARYPELAGVGDPGRPGIVHRLDGGTSGLLVVARTPEAYELLVDMLRRHDVERVYDALVWGTPESPNGLIDAPIGRDPRDPLRMAVVATGRPSRTRYAVESTFRSPPVAALTCTLETGRTHQIRVHLAAIGHPVVADHQYAGRRPTLGLARPFLHARRLAFAHPCSGAPLDFSSDRPADLVAALASCEG